MKILIFGRSYFENHESVGQLLTELSEGLSINHDVTVICGAPRDDNEKNRIFLSSFCEVINGVTVKRTPVFNTTKSNLFLRLLNLGVYFLYSFISGFNLKVRPDIILTQSDPPLIGAVGVFFSYLYNAKFVYYPQDFFYDIALKNKKLKNPFLLWLLKHSENKFLNLANLVICIGESVKQFILLKNIAPYKVHVVTNWIDTSSVYPISKGESRFAVDNRLQSSFNVLYSGNMGYKEDLDCVLEVAKKVTPNKSIKFILVGEGAIKSDLMKKVESENINNVIFFQKQKKENLRNLLCAADLHLIPTRKDLVGLVVPSKVYGIMASGRPYISWMGKNSELDYYASKYKCGVNLECFDINSVADCVLRFANNTCGDVLCDQSYISNHDKKLGVEKVEKLLLELYFS